MKRLTSIVLLVVMGIISNHLPLLWVSYNTVQSSYARELCQSKETSCHGSCTMKRDYIEQTSTESETGSLATILVETAQEIAPYLTTASY